MAVNYINKVIMAIVGSSNDDSCITGLSNYFTSECPSSCTACGGCSTCFTECYACTEGNVLDIKFVDGTGDCVPEGQATTPIQLIYDQYRDQYENYLTTKCEASLNEGTLGPLTKDEVPPVEEDKEEEEEKEEQEETTTQDTKEGSGSITRLSGLLLMVSVFSTSI